MIDTNALLNIAFSILANFTNAVYVPPETLPQNTNDLAAYAVGRPDFPTAVGFRHKSGSKFSIWEGAVCLYEAPDCYYTRQNLRDRARFVGQPAINSNQVVELATKALRRLVKRGDPLAGITPRVEAAPPYKGQPVPFYDLSWPRPRSAPWDTVADVAVDARSGRIIMLSLFDAHFADPAYDEKIAAQVVKPDPPVPVAPRVRTSPQPTTNEVVAALTNWLRFCQQFQIDPGGQTNLAQVDWDGTRGASGSHLVIRQWHCTGLDGTVVRWLYERHGTEWALESNLVINDKT